MCRVISIFFFILQRDSQNPSRELRVGTYVVESRDACKKEFGKKFNNQEICIASNPKATFCSVCEDFRKRSTVKQEKKIAHAG